MAATGLLGRLRRSGILLSLLLGSAAPAAPPRAQEIRATWIGGATLVFRFGPITVVTDPVLGGGARAFRMFDPDSGREDVERGRLAPLPPVALAEADLVLVSHDHEDHLDAAALAHLGARALLLVPAAQAAAVRRRSRADVLGLAWNGVHRFEKDGHSVTVTALAAQHSPRPDVARRLGEVNGYWLEFRRAGFRRTVYWTGNGFPVPAEVTRERQRPDLLVEHLGALGDGGRFGRVGMGASEAVTFARLIEPRTVLPIPHSAFSLYREPIERFVEAARGQSWQLAVLPEGGELVLP